MRNCRGSSLKCILKYFDPLPYRKPYPLKSIKVKRQRIMNEIKFLKRLVKENNIVRLLDYFTTPCVNNMVMEHDGINFVQSMQN